MFLINRQPIEKKVVDDGLNLSVHSIFYTIQGEGPHTGRPAVFIRLAGCNLQCPACDTDYTTGRQELHIDRICARAGLEFGRASNNPVEPLAVLTGGEPFRQPIGPLVHGLVDIGFHVQIETAGTLWSPGPWLSESVDIVCSPKTPNLDPSLVPLISAYKYVLDADHVDAEDGLPTRVLLKTTGVRVARPPSGFPRKRVYVQPLDEKNGIRNGANAKAAVESCMKFGYTLGLQTHKILGLE